MSGWTGVVHVRARRESPHLGPVGEREGGVVVEDCGVGQLKRAAVTLTFEDDFAGQGVEDQGDGGVASRGRCDELVLPDSGGHVLAVGTGDESAAVGGRGGGDECGVLALVAPQDAAVRGVECHDAVVGQEDGAARARDSAQLGGRDLLGPRGRWCQ